MRVIVTIPAYNEEKTIADLIRKIHKVMKINSYNYKILVVDDGSDDKTANAAKNAGAAVYSHPKNYGLAETFISEIKKCLELKAEVIVHIDADGQYLPEEIPKLLNEIKNGYDLVLGSRFKGKIESMPLVKRLGNIAFSKAVSQITKVKITDAQTGFRAFTRELAEKIPIRSKHTYTQEQIIRAVREKFRIKEIPIYFRKRHGKSRLISNPFGYASRAWINIIRIYRDYEPLKFFGWTGTFIFLIGFLIGLYLAYLHFTTGIVGHFALVMLDVLILSIGLQVIIFGFLSDMYKG
ncbi:glycosyltransferase family 2 protein [Candidatus Woesearchaeota archaeon]|nr:glycosyltransferase family 2 protein [Candidatus Woesearchaeota archaeon]